MKGMITGRHQRVQGLISEFLKSNLLLIPECLDILRGLTNRGDLWRSVHWSCSHPRLLLISGEKPPNSLSRVAK